MKVSLKNLYIKQKQLNDYIFVKHNLKITDCLNELKLALLVELSELANEIKCFKFWSNKASSEHDVILEEYVDCIHFLCSFAYYFEAKSDFAINNISITKDKKIITANFLKIYETVNKINFIKDNAYNKKVIENLIKSILGLGFILGFTIDQIIDGYNKKYEINISRQKNGY